MGASPNGAVPCHAPNEHRRSHPPLREGSHLRHVLGQGVPVLVRRVRSLGGGVDLLHLGEGLDDGRGEGLGLAEGGAVLDALPLQAFDLLQELVPLSGRVVLRGRVGLGRGLGALARLVGGRRDGPLFVVRNGGGFSGVGDFDGDSGLVRR